MVLTATEPLVVQTGEITRVKGEHDSPLLGCEAKMSFVGNADKAGNVGAQDVYIPRAESSHQGTTDGVLI
jgi:hypothetical protein